MPYYLDYAPETYIAIRYNGESKRKIGFIQTRYLYAKDQLKEQLPNNMNWEVVRNLPEKWKLGYKNDMERFQKDGEIIEWLKQNGIELQNYDVNTIELNGVDQPEELNLEPDNNLGLLPGEFAIPELNWGQPYPELQGYNFTVPARVTSMINNGYGFIINNNFDVRPATPNEVENVIMNKLEDLDLGNDQTLSEIFHLIQLWGGNSSWNYYDKYADQFDDNNYREFINVIINTQSEHLQQIVNATRIFCEQTPGINIPFITKHIRFWQKAHGYQDPLPIYDSIMGKYSMGRMNQNNRWKDLLIYWSRMLEEANQIRQIHENFTTWELERMLFIFFSQNPEENGWNR